MRARLAPRALVAIPIVAVLSVTAVALVAPRVPRSRQQWDDGIGSVAREVEKIRGLRFKHPVSVELLTDQQFVARVSAPPDLRLLDRSGSDQQTQELRALGVLDGNVDVSAATAKVQTTLEGGFYDPKTKHIVVRAGRFDVAARVALAHELTHALQDQRFGLDRVYREAQATLSSYATQALIEGDAVWVQQQYLLDLPARERTAYEQRYGFPSGEAAPAPGIPGLFSVDFDLPYALGPIMRTFVRSTRGPNAVDDLFRHVPRSDADYITLPRLVSDAPVGYPSPPLPNADEHYVYQQDVEPAQAFEILASRLDATLAIEATDEWYGAVAVTYTRGSTTCVRTVFAAPPGVSTTRLGAALVAWAASMRPGTASVRQRQFTWILDTCDPGAAAAVHPNELVRAERVLVLRNELLAALVAGASTVPKAACVSDRALHDSRMLDIVDHPPTNAAARSRVLAVEASFLRDADQACSAAA